MGKIGPRGYGQICIQLVATNTQTLYIKTPTTNDNRIFIELMLQSNHYICVRFL